MLFSTLLGQTSTESPCSPLLGDCLQFILIRPQRKADCVSLKYGINWFPGGVFEEPIILRQCTRECYVCPQKEYWLGIIHSLVLGCWKSHANELEFTNSWVRRWCLKIFNLLINLCPLMIDAGDEMRWLRFKKQVVSYELLIVDELGFVTLSKIGLSYSSSCSVKARSVAQRWLCQTYPFQEWT